MQDTREHASAPLPAVSAFATGAPRSALALIAVIFAATMVRALVAANSGLTGDEAYYRLWALSPAVGYLDHPPMVGWFVAAGRWIAGDNPFGIRLSAVLTSLIGPFILWRTAFLLFGPVIARRSVWFALAMPMLAMGGVIITPDTPSVLFWGLAAWALAEMHAARQPNWWLAVGLFAGLGLLSKYTNLFVGASILLWLLLISANWRWFRSWQLWAGGVIACTLAAPVVIWNAEHGWISFAKQFGRVVQGRHLTVTYFAEMVGAFAGLASPVIAVLAAIGSYRLLRSAFATNHQSAVMVMSGLLPPLFYFLVHVTHQRVQPNWLAPLYPACALCAAAALERVRESHRRLITTIAVATGFALSAVIHVHAVMPLVRDSSLREPSTQMRGWPALAAEIEALRIAAGACWIATSSYATTGQLAYALRGNATVVQISEPQRYLHLPVVDETILDCPALHVDLERRSSKQALHKEFKNVRRIAALRRTHKGVPLATYPVYLTTGLLLDRRTLRAAASDPPSQPLAPGAGIR